MEDLKQKIIEFAKKTPKSKFYFSDMLTGVKKLDAMATASTVKKAASELVNEGILEYYSTGSTTLYGLKGKGISPDKSGLDKPEEDDLLDIAVSVAAGAAILDILDDSPDETPVEGGGGDFGGGGASGDWGSDSSSDSSDSGGGD